MPAGGLLVGVPWLFTNNAGVVAAVKSLAPVLSLSLLIHTCSMLSEGMLLAGTTLCCSQFPNRVHLSLPLRTLCLVYCCRYYTQQCIVLCSLYFLTPDSVCAHLTGRDLLFLVLSYVVNCALTLVSLQRLLQAGFGLQGVWLCVLQFQSTRLVQNWIRICTPGSVLNTLQPLGGDV